MISLGQATWGLFHWHDLSLIQAWISNNIHYEVWDEITYPFLNFNSAAIDIWERMNNFIPHFIMDVITYPWWDAN